MAHADLDGHDIKIEIYTAEGISYIIDHCGNVLEYLGAAAKEPAGERIVKFDVAEYLTRHETILGGSPVDPENHDGLIDILSIGYWQEDGTYESFAEDDDDDCDYEDEDLDDEDLCEAMVTLVQFVTAAKELGISHILEHLDLTDEEFETQLQKIKQFVAWED